MKQKESILKLFAASVFFVFFAAYMIAPIIPDLAREFSTSVTDMGWVIPAYMLTYGFSTLVYGPVSDRLGRQKILLSLLLLFSAFTFLVSLSWSYQSLLWLRAISGLCAGGILPIVLALIGDIYPYQQIGRPMGLMFGAVAGGIAFGSTFGAWLNPTLGWRNEFALLAIYNLILFVWLYCLRRELGESARVRRSIREICTGYVALLSKRRNFSIYFIVFLNGVFHSGTFSWLGFYLVERYQLNDVQIGQALLGYGLPGMFLAPTIGRFADRYGRRKIIPFGFFVASLSAFALIFHLPMWLIVTVITLLSVGFDMSHPLMTGVITSLDPPRRGQAMGLNAFAIFTGGGVGALAFQYMLKEGFTFAFAGFALAQLSLVFVSGFVFRNEPVNL